MGSTLYSSESRYVRAASKGYDKITTATIKNFGQSKLDVIHDSMRPQGVKIREARDSENHPNSVPIILALDVTGSMLGVPAYLIREGLPKIMSTIIEKGTPDPQILFLAIGDHECDRFPLQVAQFESGDAELDMWLERTLLEGGGGGNGGESYHLAWDFAAFHTVTDAFEKRGKKGFLFTVGDEPCLPVLPKSAIKEIMADEESKTWTAEDLLKAAQAKYHVYHIHVMEGTAGERSLGYWQNILGQNCIVIKDHTEVSGAISDIVTQFKDYSVTEPETTPVTETSKTKPTKISL